MPLIDTGLVTIYNPATRPPDMLALELVVLACAGATLAHALRARRRGDPTLLFTWLTILLYGITMEVLSYNLIKNFVHAQFTVMFYHHQLPLYVTAVYPAFLYTAIATVRRLGLQRLAEPFVVGLVIVAMDFPFDILGALSRWWHWTGDDPNTAFRWQGVPVTSYYWHLAFGGCLAMLTRAWAPRGPGWRGFWRVVPAAALTIVLGMISFGPFHALKYLGVPDGTIVAGALALSLGIAVMTSRRAAAPGPDPLLLAIPILFYAYHLVLAVAIGSSGRLAVIVGVTLFAAAVNLVAHRARRPAA